MRLFITGASGYIGGSIAIEAVRRGHRVRGLIRSTAKAEQCRAHGIMPVLGNLADHALLAAEAKAADAVVNAASSDDRGAIDALLGSLTGSGKSFLHTSGSSVVADDAQGEPSDQIYDEDHLPVPTSDKTARFALDQAVLGAPGIRSAVLCNALVYGTARNSQARSIQLPLLIDLAREAGHACYVGRGLNRWSTVHIEDLVDLYLLALDKAPAGTFAFVESGEASFGSMAHAIADALHLGAARSMSMAAAEQRWGRTRARYSMASNSRVRSIRTGAWGWTPKGPKVEEWIASDISRA